MNLRLSIDKMLFNNCVQMNFDLTICRKTGTFLNVCLTAKLVELAFNFVD